MIQLMLLEQYLRQNQYYWPLPESLGPSQVRRRAQHQMAQELLMHMIHSMWFERHLLQGQYCWPLPESLAPWLECPVRLQRAQELSPQMIRLMLFELGLLQDQYY